jgi:hypothetical protein
MRATLSAMAALAVVLVSELAWACPVCAQREEPGSLQWFALGALVVLPWFVVGGAAWWMKRSMQKLTSEMVVLAEDGTGSADSLTHDHEGAVLPRFSVHLGERGQ